METNAETNSISFQMPNTSSYVKGMEDIVNGNYHLIPQAALARMQKINGKVMEHMTNIIPPITQNLGKGRATFRDTATELRNKVDAVISDIHLKTVRSSKSFDDIYERFGPDRSVMSLIACMLILLVCILYFFNLQSYLSIHSLPLDSIYPGGGTAVRLFWTPKDRIWRRLLQQGDRRILFTFVSSCASDFNGAFNFY